MEGAEGKREGFAREEPAAVPWLEQDCEGRAEAGGRRGQDDREALGGGPGAAGTPGGAGTVRASRGGSAVPMVRRRAQPHRADPEEGRGLRNASQGGSRNSGPERLTGICNVRPRPDPGAREMVGGSALSPVGARSPGAPRVCRGGCVLACLAVCSSLSLLWEGRGRGSEEPACPVLPALQDRHFCGISGKHGT